MVDINELLDQIAVIDLHNLDLLLYRSKYLKNFVVPIMGPNGKFILKDSNVLILGYIDQKMYLSYTTSKNVFVTPSPIKTSQQTYHNLGFLKYGEQVEISNSSIQTVDEGDETCVKIIWKPTVWLNDKYIQISLAFITKKNELDKFNKAPKAHDACDYCSSSGGKPHVDEHGKFFVVCEICSYEHKASSTCNLCEIECFYDNSFFYGLCKNCLRLCTDSDVFLDSVVDMIGEKKGEYDALVLEVNRALGLQDDEGTFATLGTCKKDVVSTVENKMRTVVLIHHTKLWNRTYQFYKDIEGPAIQACLKTMPRGAIKAFGAVVDEDADGSEPAKKRQKINN